MNRRIPVLAIATVLALSLVGCNKGKDNTATGGASGAAAPRVDTSTDEKMTASVKEVRDSLPADRREAFDKAVMAVCLGGENLFSLAASGPLFEARMKERLNGKTADEIFATAAKVEQDAAAQAKTEKLADIDRDTARLQPQFDTLQSKQVAIDAAKEKLKAFKVEKVRLYFTKNDGYRDELTIDITVKNGLDMAVASICFHGVVTSPGREVPWCDGRFYQSVPGGLNPGEEATWTLTPGTVSLIDDGPWFQVPSDRHDLVLTAETIEAEGPGDQAIYDAKPMDTFDQSQLEDLRKQLADLKKQRAELTSQPSS